MHRDKWWSIWNIVGSALTNRNYKSLAMPSPSWIDGMDLMWDFFRTYASGDIPPKYGRTYGTNGSSMKLNRILGHAHWWWNWYELYDISIVPLCLRLNPGRNDKSCEWCRRWLTFLWIASYSPWWSRRRMSSDVKWIMAALSSSPWWWFHHGLVRRLVVTFSNPVAICSIPRGSASIPLDSRSLAWAWVFFWG